MDKISIITVTFNAAATLEQTILSVAAQQYANIEYIIIDGKSSDGTVGIIKKYEKELAFWVSEKDKGIYDAMNKGIQAATGEWVYFLGADDLFIDAHVLEELFGNNKINEADLIYGNIRLSSSGKLFGGSRNYQQLIAQNISHQAIFYKKELLTQNGGYDTRYKILADYDINLKIFRDERITKLFVPVEICLFNDKGASNATIDSAFFSDNLTYFTSVERVPKNAGILQHYNFYHGIVLLIRDRKMKGMVYCTRAFLSGPRKIFYMLVFVKFMLGQIGIGKKIKIV